MDYLDYIKDYMEKENATLWQVAGVFMHPDCADMLAELTEYTNKIYSLNVPEVVVKQWAPLFLQLGLYQRDNLKQAIEQYEYPDGMPNLTKDRTNDFTVDWLTQRIVSLHYRDEDGYPETIKTNYLVNDSENFQDFMFGVRHVVMPDNRVFQFD